MYHPKYHFAQIIFQFRMEQAAPPDSIMDVLRGYIGWQEQWTRKGIWDVLSAVVAVAERDVITGQLFLRPLTSYKKKWIHIRYLLTGVKPEPAMSSRVAHDLMDSFDRFLVQWKFWKVGNPGRYSISLRMRMIIRARLVQTDEWHDSWDEYFPMIQGTKKLDEYTEIIGELFEKADLLK